MATDREILLKLHRQFSENETVAMQEKYIQKIEKQIKALNFKIGEQKSEIAELKHCSYQENAVLKDTVKKYKTLLTFFQKKLETRKERSRRNHKIEYYLKQELKQVISDTDFAIIEYKLMRIAKGL